MSMLTEVILKAGILSEETLREMQRWGLPVGEPQLKSEYDAEMTPGAISQAISNAIEDQGYVLTRETDLSAIPQYVKTAQPAVLHVIMDNGEHADFEVQVGRTNTNEWILPWQEEDITDMLTNGETYLKVKGQKVYFNQARELFYGRHKAFIVCTPSMVEPNVSTG
jgi:hypothetical protein